jgi:hypothetical protein
MTTVVNQHAPMTPEAAAQHVLQLATGHIVASALSVALELRIADHLSAPRSSAELAKALGVQEDPLYRVMRVLASVGVFNETSPRTFDATPVTEMMRSDLQGTPYAMARLLCDSKHFLVYSELMESVKTGKPALEKVFGAPAFEVFERDREWGAMFNEAMTSFSAQLIPAALDAYDMSNIGVLVDVAGGHGEVLIQTLRRYPRMRGILFDLGHVIAGAKARFADARIQDRVDVRAGDFFQDVPPDGDAYLMKHIIHDWDDERAGTILKNIRRALTRKADGKVILLESVIQPGNDPDLGKVIDLEMLTFPGGRERTADEFVALFAANDFELTRIVPTKSPLSVIEARPR